MFRNLFDFFNRCSHSRISIQGTLSAAVRGCNEAGSENSKDGSKHIQQFGAGKKVSTHGDQFGPYFDLLRQGKELLKKEYEVQVYV